MARQKKRSDLGEVRRLRKILRAIADSDTNYCPVCGNNTYEPYDCKSCGIDHMGANCQRQGHHDPSCPLYEFEADWRKERKNRR